jgi:hypothetical protein
MATFNIPQGWDKDSINNMLLAINEELSSTGLQLDLKQYNGFTLDEDRGMHFLEFEVTNIESLLKDTQDLNPTASKVKEALIYWDRDITPLVDLKATITLDHNGKTQSIQGTLTISIIYFN